MRAAALRLSQISFIIAPKGKGFVQAAPGLVRQRRSRRESDRIRQVLQGRLEASPSLTADMV